MRHGNAGNARFRDVEPVADPSQEWTATVSSAATTDPLVDDSLVITTGPRSGTITAIEAATGRRNQTVGVDGVDGTPLAVLEHTLYALDSRGRIVARDVVSGDSLWQYPLQWLPAGFSVTETSVYAAVPASTEVVAVDRTDGSERWTFDLVREPGAIAATNGIVVATMDRYLFAIESGQRRWSRRFDAEITVSILDERTAFVATAAGKVSKLGTSGDEQWTVSIDDTVRHGALTDDTLFVSTSSGVVAVDRRSGARDTLDVDVGGQARLTACRNRLYAASGNSVTCVDVGDGESVGRTTFDRPAVAGPTALDGFVLLRTSSTAASRHQQRLHALAEG